MLFRSDLVSFLNEQGEQLVKSGREYRWKKHDSVTVSGNRWYRHSQSKGGFSAEDLCAVGNDRGRIGKTFLSNAGVFG